MLETSLLVVTSDQIVDKFARQYLRGPRAWQYASAALYVPTPFAQKWRISG